MLDLRPPHWLLAVGGLAVSGCGGDKVEPLTEAELRDPASCVSCHPAHVEQWQGSMHAYAAEDPVFRAMNARGQRETDGELGDFCVQCHAPVALSLGLTEDGTNLDEVPAHLRGVTCIFCHRLDEVTGSHNAQVSTSTGNTLLGGIFDPIDTPAHASAGSLLHDRDEVGSAAACGACHDVVTPAGVHLEQTYLQWSETVFAVPEDGLQQTCGSCHLPGSDGPVAEGGPVRRVHNHAMPGVDVHWEPGPLRDAEIERVEEALYHTVLLTLEVFDYGAGTGLVVSLDNVAAGHDFPSGAAHDRRAWVELVARDEAGAVLWSSGLIDEDTAMKDALAADPTLWWLGDHTRAADGSTAHMFWDVASVDRGTLPGPSRFSPTDERYRNPHPTRTFDLLGLHPASVSAAIRIRPMGRDVLEDLVASGDLDPSLLDAVPTFTLGGSVVEWRADGR